MDLEKLIDAVAERVILKLKTKKIPPQPLVASVIDDLLNDFIIGNPVLIGDEPSAKSHVVTAITRHQLLDILHSKGAANIAPATLTAMLKAKGIRPFVSDEHSDSRNRFYLYSQQTQCYAFSPIVKTTRILLAEVGKLQNILNPRKF